MSDDRPRDVFSTDAGPFELVFPREELNQDDARDVRDWLLLRVRSLERRHDLPRTDVVTDEEVELVECDSCQRDFPIDSPSGAWILGDGSGDCMECDPGVDTTGDDPDDLAGGSADDAETGDSGPTADAAGNGDAGSQRAGTIVERLIDWHSERMSETFTLTEAADAIGAKRNSLYQAINGDDRFYQPGKRGEWSIR